MIIFWISLKQQETKLILVHDLQLRNMKYMKKEKQKGKTIDFGEQL